MGLELRRTARVTCGRLPLRTARRAAAVPLGPPALRLPRNWPALAGNLVLPLVGDHFGLPAPLWTKLARLSSVPPLVVFGRSLELTGGPGRDGQARALPLRNGV